MRTAGPNNPLSLLLRAVMFLIGAAALYVGAIAALASWTINGERVLFMLNTPRRALPGGGGYSAQRLQEAETYGTVDVLTLGSSHAVGTFDTRVFDSHGVRLFNLGAPLQNMTNSYYLLREYFPRLKPRVVLLEMYWAMLKEEGGENVIDLLQNKPTPDYLLDMAWETGRVETFNLALGRFLTSPRVMVKQRHVKGAIHGEVFEDFYYPGGYVDHVILKTPPNPDPTPGGRWEPNPRQLAYVERIIQLAQEQGAVVLLVLQSLPQWRIDSVTNREELRATIRGISARYKTEYVEPLPNLPANMFQVGDDHLNSAGARLFSEEVYAMLVKRGLVTPHDSEIK